MDHHRPSASPVIGAVILLLMAIYFGCYCGLVVPRGVGHGAYFSFYRLPHIDPLFWPLEQADRRIRPGEWFHLQEDRGLRRITWKAPSIPPAPIDATPEVDCHD